MHHRSLHTLAPTPHAMQCGLADLCGASRGLPILTLATALLLLVATQLSVVVGGGVPDHTKEPVYLLNTMYSKDKYHTRNAEAIWEGIDAALYASNYTAAGGRPLQIVELNSSVYQSGVVDVVETALETFPKLLTMVGPYSDDALVSVLASKKVVDSNLVCMSPFTASSVVRTWSNSVYFTHAEPLLELRVMLKYIMTTLRATRIGYMYVSGVNYGAMEYQKLCSLLSVAAWAPPVLYAVPYSTTNSSVDEDTFDAFADIHPQVVIVWGMPGDQVLEFTKRLLTDPRTTSTQVMGCFGIQSVLQDAYDALLDANIINEDETHLVVSATSLPPTDMDVGATHIEQFRTEMGNYIAYSGHSLFSLTDSETDVSPNATLAAVTASFFDRNAVVGQLMVAGWLSGKILQQAVNRADWISDRATFQKGLFDQNRYVVGGDAVLGDYGGECDRFASMTGAMCECNQGGHASYLIEFTPKRTWKFMTDTALTYTQSSCYASAEAIPNPLNVVTLSVTDSTTLAAAAGRIASVFLRIFDSFSSASVSASIKIVNCTIDTMGSVLQDEVTNYAVAVLVGPVLPEMDVGDLMVTAPSSDHPHLTIQKRNFIYMMPTLEQEIYLLYAHLTTVAAVSGVAAKIQVVLHGYSPKEVNEMTTVLSSSAATFGNDDPTIITVDAASTVAGYLSPTAVNLVVGVREGDHAAMVQFLVVNPTAQIAVDYRDLALSYRIFVDLFTLCDPLVQRRFVTFTNMPLWSTRSVDADAESPLLTYFYSLYPDPANHTPATLEDTIASAVLLNLAQATDVVSGSTLVDTIYSRGVLAYAGLTLGQFQWTCTTTAKGEMCTDQNYGAQRIVILSMERILNPGVSNTVDASTPAMLYTERTVHKGLTSKQLAGVLAGSVVGCIAILACIFVFHYGCVVDARNNNDAPKEMDGPVTIMFTDIESSTALWAALPQRMPDAVALHHRIIRSIIQKHHCYEVKTLGDSFMIACRNASAAVGLAMEIQTKLLKAEWRTTEIDALYRRFHNVATRQRENTEASPVDAELTPEVQSALWNGLRVRIGLHTGLSDIRRDEVTKGFDYYGDTSNMAARTEAIANGGQVIATEATWWALSDALRQELNVRCMGPQGLRGVPHTVEMYQLNAVPGRQYADLRTEVEAILPEAESTCTGVSSVDPFIMSRGVTPEMVATVIAVLSSCFSPYPVVQRVRALQPLLAKWRVGTPAHTSGISQEDYCQALVNRLSIRVATVTRAQHWPNHAERSPSQQSLFSIMDTVVSFNNPLGSVAATELGDEAPLQLRDRSKRQVSPCGSGPNGRRKGTLVVNDPSPEFVSLPPMRDVMRRRRWSTVEASDGSTEER